MPTNFGVEVVCVVAVHTLHSDWQLRSYTFAGECHLQESGRSGSTERLGDEAVEFLDGTLCRRHARVTV